MLTGTARDAAQIIAEFLRNRALGRIVGAVLRLRKNTCGNRLGLVCLADQTFIALNLALTVNIDDKPRMRAACR